MGGREGRPLGKNCHFVLFFLESLWTLGGGLSWSRFVGYIYTVRTRTLTYVVQVTAHGLARNPCKGHLRTIRVDSNSDERVEESEFYLGFYSLARVEIRKFTDSAAWLGSQQNGHSTVGFISRGRRGPSYS